MSTPVIFILQKKIRSRKKRADGNEKSLFAAAQDRNGGSSEQQRGDY